MVIDKELVKINLIKSIITDYFTIKETASVSAVYSSEEQKLHVVITCGMAGFDFTMEVHDLLEEDDPEVLIKLLLSQLKGIGMED